MASSWTVTGQAPDQYEFDGAGNPVSGYRVSFITGMGQKGSVFVPEAQYRPEAVKTLIEKQASLMDQVANLASQG